MAQRSQLVAAGEVDEGVGETTTPPHNAHCSGESTVGAVDTADASCSGKQSQTPPLVVRAQAKVCLPLMVRSMKAAVMMLLRERIGGDSLLNLRAG
jgi:hypothetical protein